MAEFKTKVIVKKVGTRKWEVYEPLKYLSDLVGLITVPTGMQTDFASIPRLFWRIAPPDGKYTGAAIVHDYIYKHKLFTRKKCDKVFLEAMKILGVGWVKRRLMYRAVRMFGWISGGRW